MEILTYTMTNQITYNSISVCLCKILNCFGNFKEVVTCFGILDALEEALARHIDETSVLLGNLSDCMRSGSIGMIPLINNTRIKTDDIALLQDPLLIRNAMNDLIVDGYTDGCRVSLIIQEGWNAVIAADHFLALAVDVHGGYARTNNLFHLLMNDGQDSSGLSHKFNFVF